MGAQSVDTMTHPEYQGRGIYTSLAKESYTYAASQGIELLYRFPNEQSRPLALKLGWSDLGTLPCLAKILNPKSSIRFDLARLPRLVKILNPKFIIQRETRASIGRAIAKSPTRLLLKSLRGSPRLKPDGHVKIDSIGAFDGRFDDFWSKVKDIYPISVWKDSKYLNWRYHYHPDVNYTVLATEEAGILVSFIVLRSKPGQIKIGYIADLLFMPGKEEAASLLISDGLDYLRKQGMDMAMFHMFEHSPPHGLLKAHGFTEYHGMRELCPMVRPNRPDFPSSVILNHKLWHLTEGDIDTY